MMTFAIFILGTITVILSCVVSFKFYRKFLYFQDKRNRGFSLALCFQLLGEAIIGFGTLVFAWAAHFGYLETWSIELQSSIRFVMFMATSLTTIHLFRTISKIENI